MFGALPQSFSPYSPSSRLWLNVTHIDPAAVFGAAAARAAIESAGAADAWTQLETPQKQRKEKTMAQTQPSTAREQVRHVVPKLIDLSEKVLFGDVWERPGLSKRDRSLITCATLIALGREKQLVGHLQRALDNGLSKNELSEVITHLAFYAGWPAAMTAALVAKEVFEKK